MELENFFEKNDIVVSCDENFKICVLVVFELDLELNELVGVLCIFIVEVCCLLVEGSFVMIDSCLIKLGEVLDNCVFLVVMGVI